MLLSKGLAEAIEAEVAALTTAESPEELKGQLIEALGSSWVSNYELMAELTGQSSKLDHLWKRISALHAGRYE